MTKEQLKALGIADDAITAIIEDYGKNYVSKEQFNAKNDELKAIKTEQKAKNEELEALKKANEGNEALKKQIEELQATQAKRETEYQETIKQKDVERILGFALRDAKAKNDTCVKALLKLDNVEIEGDTIKGLSDQLETIKKDNPYLFESEKAETAKPKNVDGFKPNDTPKTGGTVTKEQFDKMTYQQKVNLYNENRELFVQLSE